MATVQTCPACNLRGLYTGMMRESPARYRVGFRCDCGHSWSAVVAAEEAQRLRSMTPPGVPVATGTAASAKLLPGAELHSLSVEPPGLLVFLSAPVRPVGHLETKDSNLARARAMYARLCLHHVDVTFLAPWILNCEVFTETSENIKAGMRRNFRVIDVCDELWLVGNELRSGMATEAKYARSKKKIVRAVAWNQVEAEVWHGEQKGER